MRATRGLMASMGAATCLILAATIALTLVSGVIAFRGWPGVGSSAGGEQGALVARARAEAAVRPAARLRVPSARKALASVHARSVPAPGPTRRGPASQRRTTGTSTQDTARTGAAGLPAPGTAGSSPQAPQTPAVKAGAGEPLRQLGGTVAGTVDQAGKAAGTVVEPVVPGAGPVVDQVTGAVGQAITGTTGAVGQVITGAVGQVVDGLGPKP